MTELLTAAQMRAIEQAAIESGEVTGLELMERAGQGVVAAVFAEWPELAAPKPSAPAAGGAGGSTPSPLRGSPPEYLGQDDNARRAVVLCGPGNNGGDGFVVARLLKEAGWDVEVFLYGDADKLPPDAKVNYERWFEIGEVSGEMEAFRASGNFFSEYALVIDALFGIGLSRPIKPYWRNTLENIEAGHPHCRTVALDVPSGFNGDTGFIIDYPDAYLKEMMSYVDAMRMGYFDMTATFHRLKVAHSVAECAAHCGKIVVVDIGL